MTRDFERALTKCKENVSDTLFFKKIDEKNIKELFDVEKNNLFYNVVTQQFCRNDACETCNSERQIKSFFKFLMIKLQKFLKKAFCDYKSTRSTEIAKSARRMRNS